MTPCSNDCEKICLKTDSDRMSNMSMYELKVKLLKDNPLSLIHDQTRINGFMYFDGIET